MAASYTDYTSTTSTIKDFTFPYIKQSDIKVRKTTSAGVVTELVEGTLTSQSPGQYTWTNATRITLNDAPVSADTIRVYRDTASDALVGTFYPGSAIRSSDLNDNFTQNLYVTQEAEDSVDTANTSATAANTTADAAKALATTASGNATTALNNSQDLSADPSSAIDIAQAAETTANNARITANAAADSVSTVLPYAIKANAAAVQALFGGSDSPTADDIFEMTATDDLPVKILSAAWASGTTYKVNDQRTNDSGKLYLCTVAGTSAGSGGPTGTGSSITDNTVTWKYIAAANGIWTISNVPSPLPTLSTGITVKLKYASGDASASTWAWQSYHANNPEERYAPTVSPTFTGTVAIPNIANVETAITAKAPKASPALTGTATGVNLTLSGDLTVNGTTTTINSTTLKVDDKNIELGTVDTPSDATADGGGITLKGGSDKTILWTNSTDSWDFNQDIKTSGTVTDSKGDVRNIPASTNSTLVPADAGKHISITAGITINASTDFAIGDAVTIFNNQAAGNDETITATGIDLYLATDASVSGATNRTLAPRGIATILCVAADKYVITGAGLS